mmetsp:Transcript_25324/g.53496  ORF Transcript_25324/g.53496 Transcript_25324/m.53496 type:complete len:156 (-) Transcript_25324:660-1127(-)
MQFYAYNYAFIVAGMLYRIASRIQSFSPPLSLRRTTCMMMQQPTHSHLKLQHGGACILSQSPLFGRLTKAGRDYLLRHGWKDDGLSSNEEMMTTERLAFVWPNKSGPQFEMNDANAAHVRPFPKHWTDVFDDKLLLAHAMEGSAFAPASIPSSSL